jgi:hypothetical protein
MAGDNSMILSLLPFLILSVPLAWGRTTSSRPAPEESASYMWCSPSSRFLAMRSRSICSIARYCSQWIAQAARRHRSPVGVQRWAKAPLRRAHRQNQRPVLRKRFGRLAKFYHRGTREREPRAFSQWARRKSAFAHLSYERALIFRPEDPRPASHPSNARFLKVPGQRCRTSTARHTRQPSSRSGCGLAALRPNFRR